MNIFLVKSPLQLLNAIEAVHSFSLSHCILVINYEANEQNNKQIESLLNLHSWFAIIRVRKDKRPQFLIHYLIIRRIMSFSVEVQGIYIGDYRMDNFVKYLDAIPAKESVLLDDGAATIRMYNNYISQNRRPKKGEVEKWIKFAASTLLGIRGGKPYDLSLFTVFDFPNSKNCKVHKNNYRFLSSAFADARVSQTKGIIIGAKTAELGMQSEENYIKLLRHTIDQHKEASWEYIPHRGEDAVKLSLIQDKLKLKVNMIDVPIEVYILSMTDRPYFVCGFVSSALLNIKCILPQLKTEAYVDRELYAQFEDVIGVLRQMNVDVYQVN